MKDEVDTVIGFLDMPPYVTIVPPCLETNTSLHHEDNLRPYIETIINKEKNQ